MQKLSEFKISLTDEDILIIPSDQDELYQCCCKCGFWHRIEIERRNNGQIALRFFPLDEDDPYIPEHVEIRTVVEKAVDKE